MMQHIKSRSKSTLWCLSRK
ncbi:unnamed protein product [Acanthoscelides obtectus]|uniref:Uncharacterized protein n=1 Tax=Acanthoscelides obtectus TaxID=200917 RepID=A0A9P0P569_ACAOB|nr:unnamed protein product [Acanthoscelides obtectus]CAK1626357.1 hypothetical protein AOBTE_LOCUS3800 [Acanthoscelides obtectus]